MEGFEGSWIDMTVFGEPFEVQATMDLKRWQHRHRDPGGERNEPWQPGRPPSGFHAEKPQPQQVQGQ